MGWDWEDFVCRFSHYTILVDLRSSNCFSCDSSDGEERIIVVRMLHSHFRTTLFDEMALLAYVKRFFFFFCVDSLL